MDREPLSLSVAPGPHMRRRSPEAHLMLDLLTALIPALVIGVLNFGFRAALIVGLGAFSAWLFNGLVGLCEKKPRWGELSSAMVGLLLAMLLPANVPLWIPPVGAFVAIVVVRELTGGVSKNIFNPAMAAFIFLLLAFPNIMNKLPTPRSSLEWFGVAPNFYSNHLSDFWTALSGRNPAAIGTSCPAALVVGGVYLAMRRISGWKITAAGLAAAFAALACFKGVNGAAGEIMRGSLIFTAVFVATDPVTAPVTTAGRIIYGAAFGLLSVAIGSMGVYRDGAGFALLLMNTLVWYIDLRLVPKMERIFDFIGDLLGLAAAGLKRRAGREVKE